MSTIEINQSEELTFQTTLYVRDHCLCLHTQRAARALTRIFDIALKPHGITSGQFSLLMSLNRPEPPTLGNVATLLAMDRTTLTANLKPLERSGLVIVNPDPNDRRARHLRLSAEGFEVLKKAKPIWKQVHAEIEDKLSQPDKLRSELKILSQLG